MNWQKLKEKIYYWDGSWRDIYIKEFDRNDWAKWIDFVNKGYKIDWINLKTSKGQSKIDFDVICDYWNRKDDLLSTAKIYINKIQINTHFFSEEEFESDIDPREFNSLEDHNNLINYLKDISKLLNREIILTPENFRDVVLLTVNNGKITC